MVNLHQLADIVANAEDKRKFARESGPIVVPALKNAA
jgi:hypothetical protein